MGTPVVIEVEISADRAARLADAVIGPQVHFLVFDAAPEPFDKHVVPPRALAVHADRDAVVGEHAGKSLSGELRALIRVEDLRQAFTGVLADNGIAISMDGKGAWRDNV